MTDWMALTERTLEQLKEVDDRYRPTDFWGPGLEELLTDMRTQGLESFKSWRTAGFWFYPMYGTRLTGAQIEDIIEHAQGLNPAARPDVMRGMLNGAAHARRDFDAARLAWDHQRWPIRLRRLGESKVGNPPQLYPMTGQEHGWTHPYLNYMTCMAALSQHVDTPPRSVLELGGGFGVLGEFLLPRSPEMRYVDLDIPPLMTVASYYLRTLFGDRVAIADDLPETGPVTIDRSAVLPNWRIADVQGPFDVFVNSYSFQEMEPHVVAHYIDQVAAKDVEYVVSLNSRRGKPKLSDGHRIGVVEPVTSSFVVEQFERHGYTLLQRYGSPLLNSAGELVVLRRTDRLEASRRARTGARSLLSRAVARVRG